MRVVAFAVFLAGLCVLSGLNVMKMKMKMRMMKMKMRMSLGVVTIDWA